MKSHCSYVRALDSFEGLVTFWDMKSANTEMRAKSGTYTYSSKWDRLCTCGRTLGVHDAEAPHAFGDLALDDREGLPECDAFKLAKK